MITAERFIEQARTGNYLNIPYNKLDCQGFVEKVLADCGYHYDWRGSNHMWREALSKKYKISDIADIPAGAWVFTVKNDGGEVERGYHDNEGNASHVGIYLGGSDVMHSTKNNKSDGVQMDKITSARWTHYGLAKIIDYSGKPDARELVRKLGQCTVYDIYQAMRAEWG